MVIPRLPCPISKQFVCFFWKTWIFTVYHFFSSILKLTNWLHIEQCSGRTIIIPKSFFQRRLFTLWNSKIIKIGTIWRKIPKSYFWKKKWHKNFHTALKSCKWIKPFLRYSHMSRFCKETKLTYLNNVQLFKTRNTSKK